MSALVFVQDLLNTGRVRVPSALEAPADLGAAVRELDRYARPNLAYDPLALIDVVGEWALLALFRGCQSLVYREIDADAVEDALSRPCPAAVSPAVCYSADLAFCFLPDLIRLAGGVALDDALVKSAMALARQWPLSSVGIAGLGEVDVEGFIHHPGLRQLYADRIIERSDASRLSHKLAREAVREALGAFPELAPQLAAAIGGQE